MAVPTTVSVTTVSRTTVSRTHSLHHSSVLGAEGWGMEGRMAALPLIMTIHGVGAAGSKPFCIDRSSVKEG